MASLYPTERHTIGGLHLDDLRAEALRYRVPLGNEPFKWLASRSRVVRIARADKASDLFFDLQRTTDLSGLASSVLGCTSLPLKVDIIFLNALEPAVVFQEQISYAGHFEHERGVNLYLPLLESPTLIARRRTPLPNRVHVPYDDPDWAIAVGELGSGAWENMVFPSGKLTVMFPLETIEFSADGRKRDEVLLIFGYRSSKYRDWLLRK